MKDWPLRSSLASLRNPRLLMIAALLAGCEFSAGPVEPAPPYYYEPPPYTPPPTGGDTCQGLSEVGTCSGNTLTFCDAGVIETYVCSDYDLVCGFDADKQWYDCVAPTTCPVGYEGECNGDVITFCEGEETKVVDCAAYDLQCGWVAENAWYDCVEPVEHPTACTGVPAEGLCSGGVLSYCHEDQLVTQDCAATGLVCALDEVAGYLTCQTPPELPTTCDEISELGTCTGDVLSFCQGDEVLVLDCAETGDICTLDETTGFYACLAHVDPNPDTCGDITDVGVCEGDLLSYCSEGQLASQDCGAEGKVCALDEAQSYFVCVEAIDPAPTCGDITSMGVCEDGVLTYCEGDALQSSDCASDGKVCGWNAEQSYYDCLEDTGDPPDEPPSCGPITSEGVCDGDVLSFCQDGVLMSQTCDNGCAWDEENSYYNCL